VTSIAVNRNTSSSERTGTFVVSNENSSATVTVTQAGERVTDIFTVTPSS
jgi:VCBS repeat-containing protein